MTSYIELLEDEFLFGTPKEQYERLKSFREDAINYAVLKSREETFSKSMLATPDFVTLGSIKNIIEATFRPLVTLPQPYPTDHEPATAGMGIGQFIKYWEVLAWDGKRWHLACHQGDTNTWSDWNSHAELSNITHWAYVPQMPTI